MAELTREQLIQRARFSEQTERYDVMTKIMKKVVELGIPLSSDERNLLSLSYKYSTGNRRSAWRVITSSEQKLSGKKQKEAREYRKTIEDELTEICYELLGLVDKYLLPKATDAVSKIFYHKMKGDYYRYISEVAVGEVNKSVVSKSSSCYQQAFNLAESERLEPTNPVRLGLALNYSVFTYELLEQPEKGTKMAKKAYDDAVAHLDSLDEDSYKESTLIIQLLRDNLTLWESRNEDDEN